MSENVTKNPKFKKKNFKKGGRDIKTRGTKQVREDRDLDKNPRTNDVSWYASSDQLLNDAGRYSFNNPLGNTTRVTELTNVDASITYTNLGGLDAAIPGIMTLHYVPTVGYAENNYSPINVAMKGLYSAVRADNSGAKNYEPADLGKYLVALDSAYSLYAFLARVYGVARVYSVVNRYWPKAVLQSMHIDFDNVISNLADLRYYINSMAIKLNALCAPSSIKYFDRHFWMNSGIWKDSTNDKSQIYLYVPDCLYYYDENVSPSRLSPFTVCGDPESSFVPMTVASLISMADAIVNPLLSSEDIGIISGDLFKRYGMSGSHKLGMVDENFEVFPVFDYNVLSQVQNIRFCGDYDRNTLRIEEITAAPDAGALHQVIGKAGSSTANGGIEFAHMLTLDMNLDEITPGHVMEATRLTALGLNVYDSQDGFQYIMDIVGSELCTRWEMYTFTNGVPTPFAGSITKGSTIDTSLISGTTLAAVLDVFDYHPCIYLCTYDSSGMPVLAIAAATGGETIFDVDNYTVIGKSGLRKLHETALLSLFNVPIMGQYQ